MSQLLLKFFSSVIIFFLFIPFLLSPETIQAATVSCSAAGITGPTPNKFYVGEKIELNFTISPTALDSLLKNESITHIKVSIKRPLNTGYDKVVPIASRFSVEVDDPELTQEKTGPITGNLYMSSDGSNFRDLCGEISYTITKKRCQITSFPSLAPPNTPVNIKFSGLPNTGYSVAYNDRSAPSGYTILSSTTTNSSGNGEFNNITVPGSHGEDKTILISGGSSQCLARMAINSTVTEPVYNSGAVTPGLTGCTPADIASGKCATAGGKPCGSNTDPAIATAIGCVHTSPISFAQDILKFAVAISGGIAFLMMIMGAFQMLTSAGNPETLKGGQDRLTSAIVGLLIVILAVILLRFIGVDILGILPK